MQSVAQKRKRVLSQIACGIVGLLILAVIVSSFAMVVFVNTPHAEAVFYAWSHSMVITLVFVVLFANCIWHSPKKGDIMDTKTYYQDLGHLQNHPDNVDQDIMTITGFMDDDQKRQHLLRYAYRVKDTDVINRWFNNK